MRRYRRIFCLRGGLGFSHDFNCLAETLEIPYIFLPRATVDATFVPWLWASVNRRASGNNFRFRTSSLRAGGHNARPAALRPGPQLPRAMRFKSGQWALLSVTQNAAIEGTRLCWSTRFSASAFLNPSVARQQFQAASLQKTSALAAPLGIEVPCAMGPKLRHWADRVREWLPLRDELRHTFPL